MAPPPPPIGPPGTDICSAAQCSGAEIVNVRTLQITLPSPGTYGVNFGIADPGGEFVRVCHSQSQSAVFFNLEARETSRVLGDPSSGPVLDAMARSVRLLEAPSQRSFSAGAQCQRTDLGGVLGGQTVPLTGGMQVTLPAQGTYRTVIVPPGTNLDPGVCYVPAGAGVYLRACREAGRDATDAAANAILDQIVASCVIQAPPTELPSRAIPPGGIAPPPSIRPPETGSGGLLPVAGASGAETPNQ